MKPSLEIIGTEKHPALAYGITFDGERWHFIAAESHLPSNNKDVEYNLFRELYTNLTEIFEVKHNSYCNRHNTHKFKIQKGDNNGIRV